MRRKTLRYAFLDTLPVMAGYLVLGMGFVILLQDKGYSWVWALLMSVTIYAGSMQYVAVDLLSGGATVLAAALMTLMVNVRHLFYGISMLERYQDTGKAKPYLIFALTDETYSLVCSTRAPEDADIRLYYFLVSILNQSYWIAGSVLGAVIGSAFQFNTAGVDFAMTALFVVIFTEQWEKEKNHFPALTGVGVSVVCLLIFGPSNFLIPSMIGIVVLLFLLRGYMPSDAPEGAGTEETDRQATGVVTDFHEKGDVL
ncbi:MAG: AzlC family ABC transporter permease [Lachnospiraceae bacterium]|nr:AzlC family ABC transporter permease [Lachnospiraceae bacterium]